jgi:saccharopine dehydrogenase-like NADP-dependent oxidoreductase
MAEKATFGVVGGYGATGRVVVSELWKSSAGRILIGGRDPTKARALATEFDGRVSTALVDVMNRNSVDDFCRQCSIVVNCAGPVMVLQDRVAQAALRKQCHYVDAAGLKTVRECMLPRSREIVDLRLSCVISAGLLPGISEILPLYANARARSQMDAIESLTVYYGDTGEWSANAFQEIAWMLRQRRSRGSNSMGSGYFQKGDWVEVSMLKASHKADLGGSLGPRRFYMGFVPEMSEMASRFADCALYSYGCLPGLRTTIIATVVSVIPLPRRFGARLLRNAFRKNRLSVAGFVVVKAVGRREGRSATLTAQIAYQEQQGYWLNGLVPATVARMISERKRVETGVHFLAEAVDPTAFMEELRKSGVEQTEQFEASDLSSARASA